MPQPVAWAHYAQFTVNRLAAGPVTLQVRFANGASSARPSNLMDNGPTVATVSFEPTGSWPTWATVSLNAAATPSGWTQPRRPDYPASATSTWELPDIRA